MSTTDTETLRAQAKLLSDLFMSTGTDSGPAFDEYQDLVAELMRREQFDW